MNLDCRKQYSNLHFFQFEPDRVKVRTACMHPRQIKASIAQPLKQELLETVKEHGKICTPRFENTSPSFYSHLGEYYSL